MKSFILTIGTLLISYPLVAQTNFSPVTGAPVFDPGNTAPIPPTINNTTPGSPVNSTGFETIPPATSFGTPPGPATETGTGIGTGSGVNLGTGGSAPIPPGTTPPAQPTQQGNSIMGSGWQGI